jgi:hypothetical protein
MCGVYNEEVLLFRSIDHKESRRAVAASACMHACMHPCVFTAVYYPPIISTPRAVDGVQRLFDPIVYFLACERRQARSRIQGLVG